MRVIWAPLALERAVEIATYIAADRPGAATKWLTELFDATKSLSRFPEGGRRVPELGRSEYRELIYGNYRIIYRIESKRIAIVTVRHGRRLLDEGEILASE